MMTALLVLVAVPVLGMLWWLREAIAVFFIALLLLNSKCAPHAQHCWYDSGGHYYCEQVYVETHYVAPAKPSGGHKNIIVVEEEPSPSTTIVVVEEEEASHYCDEYNALPPYFEDPAFCIYPYHDYAECDWYIGYGCYETWAWDDYYCDWMYVTDYCVY